MLTDKQIQTLARKFEKEYDQSDGEQHPWEMIAHFLSDSGVLDKINLETIEGIGQEDYEIANTAQAQAHNANVDKLLT